MGRSGKILIYNSDGKERLSKNNQPLVSVIIPTRNRRTLLGRALASVKRQTYDNYEIIVIDDASKDGSADWASTYYPEASVIKLSKRSGSPKARNEGLKKAKGSLVAFLDSDDEWSPEYLQFQVSALLLYPTAALSFTDCIDQEIISGKIFKTAYQHDPRYPTALHRLMLASSFILTMSCVVVRKNKFEELGLLREELSVTHDREFYIRLLRRGNDIAHVPKNLALRYLQADSLCSDLYLWADDSMKLCDIVFHEQECDEYKDLEKQARARVCLFFLSLFLFNKTSLWQRLRFAARFFIYFVKLWKYVRKDLFGLICFFAKKSLKTVLRQKAP